MGRVRLVPDCWFGRDSGRVGEPLFFLFLDRLFLILLKRFGKDSGRIRELYRRNAKMLLDSPLYVWSAP